MAILTLLTSGFAGRVEAGVGVGLGVGAGDDCADIKVRIQRRYRSARRAGVLNLERILSSVCSI